MVACGEETLRPYASCTNLQICGHADLPQPGLRKIADLTDGSADFQPARIRGTVQNVFADEHDADYVYVSLADDTGSILVPFTRTSRLLVPQADALVGAEIEVTGFCSPAPLITRKHVGRLFVFEKTTPVLTRPPPTDAFDIPELEGLLNLSPAQLCGLGRRRTTGTVLAVWNGSAALLLNDREETVRLDLEGQPMPVCGQRIDVIGFPDTDLCQVKLQRCRWRRAAGKPRTHAEHFRPVSIASLVLDDKGRSRTNVKLHGKPISIRGTVRSLPAAATPTRLRIEDNALALSVDISAVGPIRDLECDAVVEVRGVCIVESENWSPNAIFPRVKEILLSVRQASDIRILSAPPWWTPRRLILVIGTLAFLSACFLILSILLRRLAERRGQALASEAIARSEADLKALERTRLAVELHDSLAQNLSGVAMEIEAATQFKDNANPELCRHLTIAERALDSCRDDLRNCLWDLRSQSLDERDLDTAIRRTLLPHVKNISLMVRTSIPRASLSDSVTHVILRIIRELTINAVRHGNATRIKVAGAYEDGKLMFSVRDNGSGFDPSVAPGVSDGHFGLQGIRERTEHLSGTFRITSKQGQGTSAILILPAPDDEQ